MTIGLILNAFAFAAASGNVALHYPKITENRASLRPRREQAIMVLALLLVGAGFFFHPGIVGSALGILAIIPASLFLLGSRLSSASDCPCARQNGSLASGGPRCSSSPPALIREHAFSAASRDNGPALRLEQCRCERQGRRITA
ncbi:MAG: hypothetical protein JO068_00420 [Hyphomicrobiales bacterium]|nr:hypothetical protein [Hyphomicrobiales bacterium]